MKPKTLSSLHGIRKHTLGSLILALIVLASGPFARGAGMLTPVDSSHQALRILDHHVDVRIIDGFARTVVQQTFSNPNDVDLEAIYAFPVPEHASLSEVRFESGETVLEGEVIPRDRAAEIYEEEKSAGREAGLASKESYQRFEFRISRRARARLGAANSDRHVQEVRPYGKPAQNHLSCRARALEGRSSTWPPSCTAELGDRGGKPWQTRKSEDSCLGAATRGSQSPAPPATRPGTGPRRARPPPRTAPAPGPGPAGRERVRVAATLDRPFRPLDPLPEAHLLGIFAALPWIFLSVGGTERPR